MSERVPSRQPGKSLCITTTCASLDELVAQFHPLYDDGSLLVTADQAGDVSDGAALELRLADGTAVVRATCGAVARSAEGVRVELRELTRDSEQVIVRLRAARAGAAAIPRSKPAAAPRTRTIMGIEPMRAPASPARKTKTVQIPAAPQTEIEANTTERMATPPLGATTLGVAEPPAEEVHAEGSAQLAVPPPAASKERRVKGLRITTPCTTIDEFVEAFHRCCEEKSFFIATRSLRPVGLESAFSVDLADGRPMLRGFGVVLDAWAGADNRFKKPGVLVGIHQLTPDSKPIFEQLLIARAVAADRPQAPGPDRRTRQMVAFGAAPAPKPRVASSVPPTITVLRPFTPPTAVTVVEAEAASQTGDEPPTIEAAPRRGEAGAEAEAVSEPVTVAEAVSAAAAVTETATVGEAAPVPVAVVAPQAIDEPATPPPLEPPPVFEARPAMVEAPPASWRSAPPVPGVAIAVDAAPLAIASRSARRRWLVLGGVFAAGVLLGVVASIALRSRPAPIVKRELVPMAIPLPIPVLTQEHVATPPAKPAVAKPAAKPVAKSPPPAPPHVAKPHPVNRPKPKPCSGLSCL